jgi:DNA-binding response OmpR family regulator
VLAYHGYEPTGAADGELGLSEGRSGSFDLVVLDVMLPGMSGFDVCEELRTLQPELPILMLTARGSEEDVLRGFRAGADDYVTKPFSISELVARVEALLRRASRRSEPQREPFDFGPFRVDPEQRVISRDGASEELTRREVQLLGVLARERGRIVSRRALLSEVWELGGAERIETRTVDMHVAKLRRKLGPDAHVLIATVRGEGYRYG